MASESLEKIWAAHLDGEFVTKDEARADKIGLPGPPEATDGSQVIA